MTQKEKSEFIHMYFTDNDDNTNIISNKLPLTLYRYRVLDDHNLLNLINNEIWLSKPQFFNDPFDSMLNVNIEEAIISKLGNKNSFYRMPKKMRENLLVDAFPQMNIEQTKINIAMERLRDSYCMACFSEKNDNLLMWSHYADFHRGICIEYSFEDLYDIVDVFLLPVLYKNKFDNSLLDLMPSSLFCKAKDWKYEQEWRIISLVENSVEGKVLYGPKPQAIYLGCKFEEKNFIKINEFARVMNLPVYQMELSKKEYKVVCKK